MAVKSYNPTSPARRQMTTADFSGLSAKSPEKSLLVKRKRLQEETTTAVLRFVIKAAATVAKSV